MTMDLIPLCFNWKIVEKHNTIRVPDEAVIAGNQRGKIECWDKTLKNFFENYNFAGVNKIQERVFVSYYNGKHPVGIS